MIISQLPQIKEMILETLFPTPKACPLCGKKQDKLQICQECFFLKANIQKEEGQCNKCGSFGLHGVYCPTCYGWPEEYIKNTAPFLYKDQFEEFVRNFKFNYHGYLAKPAAMAIFNELCRNNALIIDTAGALIVPVPMSPKRKKQKGYNQAELLALELAKIMDTKIDLKLLLRPQDRPHQVGLNRTERRKNLSQAFIVPKDRLKEIENKNILLVDDVLTTSTTLKECAKILIINGAEKVFSVTIAAGKNPSPERNDFNGSKKLP